MTSCQTRPGWPRRHRIRSEPRVPRGNAPRHAGPGPAASGSRRWSSGRRKHNNNIVINTFTIRIVNSNNNNNNTSNSKSHHTNIKARGEAQAARGGPAPEVALLAHGPIRRLGIRRPGVSEPRCLAPGSPPVDLGIPPLENEESAWVEPYEIRILSRWTDRSSRASVLGFQVSFAWQQIRALSRVSAQKAQANIAVACCCWSMLELAHGSMQSIAHYNKHFQQMQERQSPYHILTPVPTETHGASNGYGNLRRSDPWQTWRVTSCICLASCVVVVYHFSIICLQTWRATRRAATRRRAPRRRPGRIDG